MRKPLRGTEAYEEYQAATVHRLPEVGILTKSPNSPKQPRGNRFSNFFRSSTRASTSSSIASWKSPSPLMSPTSASGHLMAPGGSLLSPVPSYSPPSYSRSGSSRSIASRLSAIPAPSFLRPVSIYSPSSASPRSPTSPAFWSRARQPSALGQQVTRAETEKPEVVEPKRGKILGCFPRYKRIDD
jgi:hypothetical protein